MIKITKGRDAHELRVHVNKKLRPNIIKRLSPLGDFTFNRGLTTFTLKRSENESGDESIIDYVIREIEGAYDN